MPTVSLRMNDEEFKLMQEYTSVNNLNVSAFIRAAILDKIEDDLKRYFDS